MNLTPMQLFSQEKILLALYPWLSIEEAREKEIRLIWCIYFNNKYWERCKLNRYLQHHNYYNWTPINQQRILPVLSWEAEMRKRVINIIGLPPTLPRVLEALGDYRHIYYNWIIRKTSNLGIARWTTDWITQRKLLNDDKTDATLFDQSIETQNRIWELLWRK